MSDPSPAFPTSTAEYYRPMPVYLAPRPRQRYWLHGILLLATMFTTLIVGAQMQRNFDRGLSPLWMGDGAVPFFPLGQMLQHPSRLLLGIPFSASLMLILLAHEMGHYLYCVRYGVYATLPYFIPFPSLFGTMGAFIRIRSPIRSRPALFDIGIAGPIAGFVVACVVLVVSLGLSRAIPTGTVASPDVIEIHYPLIFQLAHRGLVWLGVTHGFGAVPLERSYLHPMAFAAWIGMFATALNLLPGGQLDGGHIIFSLAPSLHKTVSRLTILILIPMAVYLWVGWLVWAILLEISSFRHPDVMEWPSISGERRWLAVFALVMLVLTLTPQPMAHHSLKEFVAVFRGH